MARKNKNKNKVDSADKGEEDKKEAYQLDDVSTNHSQIQVVVMLIT